MRKCAPSYGLRKLHACEQQPKLLSLKTSLMRMIRPPSVVDQMMMQTHRPTFPSLSETQPCYLQFPDFVSFRSSVLADTRCLPSCHYPQQLQFHAGLCQPWCALLLSYNTSQQQHRVATCFVSYPISLPAVAHDSLVIRYVLSASVVAYKLTWLCIHRASLLAWLAGAILDVTVLTNSYWKRTTVNGQYLQSL